MTGIRGWRPEAVASRLLSIQILLYDISKRGLRAGGSNSTCSLYQIYDGIDTCVPIVLWTPAIVPISYIGIFSMPTFEDSIRSSFKAEIQSNKIETKYLFVNKQNNA